MRQAENSVNDMDHSKEVCSNHDKKLENWYGNFGRWRGQDVKWRRFCDNNSKEANCHKRLPPNIVHQLFQDLSYPIEPYFLRRLYSFSRWQVMQIYRNYCQQGRPTNNCNKLFSLYILFQTVNPKRHHLRRINHKVCQHKYYHTIDSHPGKCLPKAEQDFLPYQ